jgi:phospholipid transport system substrate-binding protein
MSQIIMLKKRLFSQLLALMAVGAMGLVGLPARAADEAPDALINRLTKEALDIIQADKALQAGDVTRIIEVMDEKVMPHLNFERMTRSAVGPQWRQATPEQRKRLEAEFKILLARTYAGAMTQAKNLTFSVKPLRAAPEDKEVIVRTVIKGRGDPIQLDYRLEKTPGSGAGWKIYNMNVMGIWLVENYVDEFKQEISAKGIDGLIASLTARNKANAAASPAKSASPAKV